MIQGLLGATNASLNAILGTTNDFAASGAPSRVKSIQRGIIDGFATSRNINITSVVPSKCMVIINGHQRTDSTGLPIYLGNLTATVLTLHTGGGSYSGGEVGSWQVIEFY